MTTTKEHTMTSASDYRNLPAGTEIYYTGDMANADDFGRIVERISDSWGVHYRIELDDGREQTTPSTSFTAGPGTRFHVKAEFVARRRAEMARYYASRTGCSQAEAEAAVAATEIVADPAGS